MKRDEALAADRSGKVADAAALYEAALLEDQLDATTVLNLIVLYWQSTDYGFSSAMGLSSGFVDTAGNRFLELLDYANKRFPWNHEVLFWSKYIAWTDLGEDLDVLSIRAIVEKHPTYNEPFMVLFFISDGSEFEREAVMLLNECLEIGTIRCKYVISVINGVLKRKGHKKLGPG